MEIRKSQLQLSQISVTKFKVKHKIFPSPLGLQEFIRIVYLLSQDVMTKCLDTKLQIKYLNK